MITTDQVYQLLMVIINIHNLQNRESCKTIANYLANISLLMYLTISAKLHILMITRQTQWKTVLKK